MRTVEDHHVDRLGVDAWQHVKLTSTNRSIGLINAHTGKHRQDCFTENMASLLWPGGYGEGPAPDSIPNSAVKSLSADGTAS